MINWLLKRIFSGYIAHVAMLLDDVKKCGHNKILHPFCYLSDIKFSLVNQALESAGFEIIKVQGRFIWNYSGLIDKYYIKEGK